MSYKALYRKYRPKTFMEVIGQDHIISTLKNIIRSDKISHAYLFTGPRGTGKTSVAHIFANEINKTPSGISMENNSFDIIEIDAASNNGVAEIRNLIEKSNYAPANSKYKVYIVDEVHMLTKGAFNALLKTLEEPPAHLVFILATTEPHKIPTTILSRTQRFNFKRIDDKLIMTALKKTLEKEEIIYEVEAIKFVSRIAQGGMRDALSIVDQAASYGNNNISFAAISQVFGIISIENQINILNLTYLNKTKDLLITIENFINNGIDIERLINSLIDILKDFIIYNKTSELELCTTLSLEEINLIKISSSFAYEAINEFIDILKSFKFSEMKKQIFEVSLLKLSNNLNVEQKNTVPPTPKKETNIFETQKTVINNVKDITNTDEILGVQEDMMDKQQSDMLDQDIDTLITSTQDIPLDEFSTEETKPTEEIDLVTYFESEDKGDPNTSNNIKRKNIFDIDELINYFLHANKEKLNKFKTLLPNIINFREKAKDKEHITLIQKSIPISAGDKFIILSSADDDIVASLKQEVGKQEFIDLISSVVEEPINTLAISKDEFEALKEEWSKLQKENTLPNKKPIKSVVVSEKPKEEVEKYAEDLFGDLFR